jgi:hypothetical protein
MNPERKLNIEKTNQELTRANLFVNRLMSILQPTMNLCSTLLLLLLFGLGHT